MKNLVATHIWRANHILKLNLKDQFEVKIYIKVVGRVFIGNPEWILELDKRSSSLAAYSRTKRVDCFILHLRVTTIICYYCSFAIQHKIWRSFSRRVQI